MLCGKCLDLMRHGNCSLLGVCGTLHANSCEAQHCDPIDRPAQRRFKQKLSSWNANSHTVDPNLLNLRVTKGLGSKGYDAIRVSQISKSAAPYSNMSFFDYSAQFKWHWTDNYLHTSMVQLGDQLSASINLGDQTSVQVKLPRAGEGIAGVFIADPCTKDASLQVCLAACLSRRVCVSHCMCASLCMCYCMGLTACLSGCRHFCRASLRRTSRRRKGCQRC